MEDGNVRTHGDWIVSVGFDLGLVTWGGFSERCLVCFCWTIAIDGFVVGYSCSVVLVLCVVWSVGCFAC